MKTLKVLTKAGHSLEEDRPTILECLQEIASHDSGEGGDGDWLVVSIDDDSTYRRGDCRAALNGREMIQVGQIYFGDFSLAVGKFNWLRQPW